MRLKRCKVARERNHDAVGGGATNLVFGVASVYDVFIV